METIVAKNMTNDFAPARVRLTAAVALTILLHFLFLQFGPALLHALRPGPRPEPKYDVETLTPSQMSEIQARMKQQLLITPKDAKSDTDNLSKPAKYFSDKTLRFKKEQQVKSLRIDQPKQTRRQPKTQAKPVLRSLGISLESSEAEDKAISEASEFAQSPDDPHAAKGNENLLNSDYSLYYTFFSRVYQAIAARWYPRVRALPEQQHLPERIYETHILLVINQAGNVIRTQVLQPSGLEILDQVSDRVLYDIGRFPNPPKELLNEQGEIEMPFNFRLMIQKGNPFWGMPIN